MRSYKDLSFDNCINAPVVNLKTLQELAWNGIPPKYRAITWKLLLGYVPTNKSRRDACMKRRREEYVRILEQNYVVEKSNMRSIPIHDKIILDQISLDVPRTAPQLGLFVNERILNSIEHILFLWAIRHPASSYVQGINDLVTPFFTVFLGDYFDGRDITKGDTVSCITNEMLLEKQTVMDVCQIFSLEYRIIIPLINPEFIGWLQN